MKLMNLTQIKADQQRRREQDAIERQAKIGQMNAAAAELSRIAIQMRDCEKRDAEALRLTMIIRPLILELRKKASFPNPTGMWEGVSLYKKTLERYSIE